MIIEAPSSLFADLQSPSKAKMDKHSDNPPAYSDQASIHGVRGGHEPSFVPPKNPPGPPPSVDQVHIFEKKHDIRGTFFIDPKVQALDQSRRKMKSKSKHQLPHASFRTRHGAITLDLATTGSVWDSPKAGIVVSSRKGDIKINLLSMPSSAPRIGLDASSRRGNITLFLPETFSGVVHLSTKKGSMNVLPALAGIMKTVKTSEKELIFLVGTQSNSDGADNAREAAFCQLGSRTGQLVVGLSGHDCYTPHVGFWKRLGGYLSGCGGVEP